MNREKAVLKEKKKRSPKTKPDTDKGRESEQRLPACECKQPFSGDKGALAP